MTFAHLSILKYCFKWKSVFLFTKICNIISVLKRVSWWLKSWKWIWNNDRKDLAIGVWFKFGQLHKVIVLTADSGVVQEDNRKMNYDNYTRNF